MSRQTTHGPGRTGDSGQNEDMKTIQKPTTEPNAAAAKQAATPGPWTVATDDNGNCNVRSENDPQNSLYRENAEAVCAANARLIAAAPELLAALQWLAEYLPERQAEIGEPLDSAIAVVTEALAKGLAR